VTRSPARKATEKELHGGPKVAMGRAVRFNLSSQKAWSTGLCSCDAGPWTTTSTSQASRPASRAREEQEPTLSGPEKKLKNEPRGRGDDSVSLVDGFSHG
jgi:hypothetical protein